MAVEIIAPPGGVCENKLVGSDNELCPINFCDNEPEPIGEYGNYGLLADIDIKLEGAEVFGAVKAGSALKVSNNTTVHGYVSGLGLGDVDHSLENKFVIDLTNLPEGYTLVESDAGQGGEGGNTEKQAVIHWSRYK